MFRASTDGGQTFSDKINLSNTTTVDSVDAEIAAEGANVIVTWWERNQTSDTPVARISTDSGETFGELIMLGTNGTIGVTEEGAEAAAAAEGGVEGEEEAAAAANGGGE
jgi:alkanesulfonate monooxygenase SsuD/methylene tetrahydromethanopterin reductase-like flavin-dependent oxidoreductase (luciferase family)